MRVAQLRAAWWAIGAVRSLRAQLGRRPLDDVRVPPVPPVPAEAYGGVRRVLDVSGSTCLVSASIRQAWDAAHGHPRDLVIGVTPPSEGFRAHAWLEGDPESSRDGYRELLRRSPRG